MTEPRPSGPEPADLPSTAKENLELLARFDDSQPDVSGVQRLIERISAFFGSPLYFIFSVVFIIAWGIVNYWGARAGWPHVDDPPFPWLQGLVSSNALVLTVAVLIRQNRMSVMAEHRSHLDLQINLLAEQKVTKLLQLVDEIHRELGELRGSEADARAETRGARATTHKAPEDASAAQLGRSREQIEEMTKPADPHAILDAIKQKKS
jgi:uncharacterized membrane protein